MPCACLAFACGAKQVTPFFLLRDDRWCQLRDRRRLIGLAYAVERVIAFVFFEFVAVR